ncbi:MAG: Calx-beta domain-containing protein, partial [Microcystis panniformis]
SNNQIYLSANFLATSTAEAISAVLLEEIGHFVDAHINLSDSAGDEGAIFAALVQGYSLDTQTLQALKAEDDHATITINGQVVAVEQNSGNIAFSAATYSINENGTPVTAVTVTRTGGSSGIVSATLNLTNGTPTAPFDYQNTPITVNFADGEITKTVNIPIVNDNLIEGNETVNLTLTNSTNGATIGTQNTATLTIVDNDTSPGKLISENLPIASYTASSSWISEGALPDKAFDGSASTSWNSGNFASQWIEVDLGQEYHLYSIQLLIEQQPGGSTTHEVWVSNQSISNSYTGATLAKTFQGFTDTGQWLESDFSNSTKERYVQVKTVSSPSWIAWVEIQIFGELLDLPTITLAVSPSSVTEDGTTNLVYTFTRTGSTTNALTVNYSITGTANTSDYTGATPGTGKTITFAAGASTATLTIDPTADTIVESDETVALTLAAGTGYTVGTTAAVTGTITNDDVTLPTITLAVSPTSVSEDGTTNLIYTFTRTGATTNTLTVNYGITGTANTSDYTGATPGTGKTITFAAGASTATLTIDPTADTIVESNETVALTLAAGTGYTIGTTAAVTGTITNDDLLPNLNLSANQTIVEGNTNPQNVTYTVTLSNTSTQTITVQYATANGTAIAGSDYTSTSGTLTFNPGVTSQVINIPILNDSLNEANETFTLNLTTPTNATLGAAKKATTTITDTLSASVTTTLPSGVENLTLTGTAAINGTGNAGDNVLQGNSANNTLTGLDGNDTYRFLANTALGTDTITETTTGGIDNLD